MNINSAITLTFGDMAENHVGMEQIGEIVPIGQGFNLNDLNIIKTKFNGLNLQTNLIDLRNGDLNKPEAYILIIKNAVDKILSLHSEHNKISMFNEQKNLDVDKKAYMYGRVVNKHARWNLCFDNASKDPDYEVGKGRIIAWNQVPITNIIYQNIEEYFGQKASNLKCEGNYYYDINKCGIGYHGDSERRKVIGVRLGASIPLYFKWYKAHEENENNRQVIPLDNGDIYVMSEKTVGTDWKKRNIFTLRHAVGAPKFSN